MSSETIKLWHVWKIQLGFQIKKKLCFLFRHAKCGSAAKRITTIQIFPARTVDLPSCSGRPKSSWQPRWPLRETRRFSWFFRAVFRNKNGRMRTDVGLWTVVGQLRSRSVRFSLLQYCACSERTNRNQFHTQNAII